MFNATPLEAFLDNAAGTNSTMTPLLANADVIVGIDVMSCQEFVVFGRQVLDEEDEAPATISVLYISIDDDTDDLLRLCWLVKKVKGYHEYAQDDRV